MPKKRLTADEAIALSKRNAHVIQMRRDNHQWADIAAEVGLTPSRCHQIFSQYQNDLPASAVASWRDEELDLLARGIRRLLNIAEDDRRDDHGKLIISAHSRVEALKEIRMHSESRRTMLGVDAPKRRELEVVDSRDVQLHAELAELENEARAAAANQPDNQ